MLMNDPSREYYRYYEIEHDRHVYDGRNWTYVNLPVEAIKEIAIASIKDSTMLYFRATWASSWIANEDCWTYGTMIMFR